MERRFEAEGSESSRDVNSTIEIIKNIAAKNARADLSDEHQLLLFLQSWWSMTYNRPLKDPILASYTLEELLYEFFDRIERDKARREQVDEEADRIEEMKEKEVLDWIQEEEKKELQGESSDGENSDAESASDTDLEQYDPAKDPENVKWMEEHLARGKQIYGEDFGEDIDHNFE
jgi:hypothetical protein